MSEAKEGRNLPSALAERDEIALRLRGRRPALFLDYDGTLTPIVSRPELATLPATMREVLKEAAARVPVAIVSGRDRRDVEALVGLEGLVYAGSHGFDITGPDGLRMEYGAAKPHLPALETAEAELRERLRTIDGAQVERKRFSIAVHYRNVRREDVEAVARVTEQVRSSHPGLRQRGGKMVHELQPRIEWDKGRAVLWLLEALGLDGPDVLPLYVGDDLTDEDAFQALSSRGIGVLVEPPARPTHAHFALRDTREVEEFLRRLPGLCGAHVP